MNLREASPEERRLFYLEEWKVSQIPDYITKTLKIREFAFDHSGEGPKDRYRSFITLSQLEAYIKTKAPYAAFSSVSFYGKPEQRGEWLGAELVFDIDAKDLPVKACSCKAGEVCEKCLDDAKQYVLELRDIITEVFDLKRINFVYSGRGYHIRILDEEVLYLGSDERAEILDYISGGVIPDNLGSKGYADIFRRHAIRVLPLLTPALLRIRGKKFEIFIENLPKISQELIKGSLRTAREVLGSEEKLLQAIAKVNAEMLDARVTVDIKRILRLPSSLHSKVSMVCTPIRDLEKFDPLSKAVPKFVGEREDFP